MFYNQRDSYSGIGFQIYYWLKNFILNLADVYELLGWIR
jgi:hypothetical protein